MQNTYYNNQGKFQTEFDQMTKVLIPAVGPCDTTAGEMLRSVTRLAYDLYNNGMGNNTSGACNFLLEMEAISYQTHETIYEYTRGKFYDGNYNGDDVQRAVETAIDNTVEFIMMHPLLKTEVNDKNMFDYEEDFQQFCEECGDECFHNTLCDDCDEMWEDED
jgi:hypothetical protein